MELFYGLTIPFLGTTLGAGMVFAMKNKKQSGGQITDPASFLFKEYQCVTGYWLQER